MRTWLSILGVVAVVACDKLPTSPSRSGSTGGETAAVTFHADEIPAPTSTAFMALSALSGPCLYPRQCVGVSNYNKFLGKAWIVNRLSTGIRTTLATLEVLFGDPTRQRVYPGGVATMYALPGGENVLQTPIRPPCSHQADVWVNLTPEHIFRREFSAPVWGQLFTDGCEPEPWCPTEFSYTGQNPIRLDNSGDGTLLAFVQSTISDRLEWLRRIEFEDEPETHRWTSDGDYAVVLIKAGRYTHVFTNVQVDDEFSTVKGISHVAIFVCR